MTKLSLITSLILGCAVSVNAAETFAEAFTNGKIKAELKATYADRTDETTTYGNENLFNLGFDLGYFTDPFYGLSIGVGMQGNGAFGVSDDIKDRNSKHNYQNEYYVNGVVLSQAYLNYGIGKTNLRFGRQYVDNMSLVGSNNARAFKEAYEGLTIVNKDLVDTELKAGWFYKYQGRTGYIYKSDKFGKHPYFDDRVVLGGYNNTKGHDFDNIFVVDVVNKSIEGLKLTAAWAGITNVLEEAQVSASNKAEGDIHLYTLEASHVIPLSFAKLGFDLGYKGSNAANADKHHYDGQLFQGQVTLKDLFGFNLGYAYSNVLTDDENVILAVGLKEGTYTQLPIVGPYNYTGLAGIELHKFNLGYNFNNIGIKGLRADFNYTFGEQDAPSVSTGKTKAGENIEIKGWNVVLNYALPQVKGLSTSLTYTSLDKENYANGVRKTGDARTTKQDELWWKFNYKFEI